MNDGCGGDEQYRAFPIFGSYYIINWFMYMFLYYKQRMIPSMTKSCFLCVVDWFAFVAIFIYPVLLIGHIAAQDIIGGCNKLTFLCRGKNPLWFLITDSLVSCLLLTLFIYPLCVAERGDHTPGHHLWKTMQRNLICALTAVLSTVGVGMLTQNIMECCPDPIGDYDVMPSCWMG